LNSGLQHFLFTGQNWSAHATKGIDWDLYLMPDGPQRFLIGSWGHNQHASPEQSQFQQTNGRPFEESQYILRVQGKGSFSTLILPYRKGERANRQVTRADCGILIAVLSESLCVGEQNYRFSDPLRKLLTTFTAQAAEFEGIAISGGPTEVVVTPEEARITASGSDGTRWITLPGAWIAPTAITASGSQYRIEYPGGDPLTLVLKNAQIPPRPPR
jgi:hypothetical protein